MIRLENITVGYGERVLLSDVSLEFAAGTLTALVGRNGTGKSTLLKAITGLGQYASGEVFLGGKPLSTLSTAEMSRTIAFVNTERVRIANLSCRDLVSMGRAPYTNWIGKMLPEDEEIVMRSLSLVGMESYALRTLDRMSDGECQRVMIARALAQQTPVILLDEPTSFLDMPNRYELCSLLADLAHNEGKCILFSTHELDIAISLCDTIALIDTPSLHHLPVDEMVHSGHIERLFSSSKVYFDPVSGSVKSK